MTVTNRIGYALWIAIALACGSALAGEIRWAPDIATARQAAMEYKVPMLIHFYGDNCVPCQVLEKNVYSKPEVIETLNKFFICVRVNASRERQTAAEYGVHSWPTDVFVSPDGKTLYQGVCSPNLADYLGTLQNVAVTNRDRNVSLAAQQTQAANQVTSQATLYPQAARAANPTASFAAPLPAAGIAPVGNAMGPNHYPQSAGDAGLQALPNSLSPNATVTSGPMLVQDQPHAITTAVQSGGNQIAPASNRHSTHNEQAHLPPMDVVAQISPATKPQTTSQQLAGYSVMPNLPTPTTPAQASGSAWTPTQAGLNSNARMIANPHFAATQTASPTSNSGAVQDAPALGVAIATNEQSQPDDQQDRLKANQVSFQPRSKPVIENSNPIAASTGASSPVEPAIDGYCPVTLKKQGAWVKGDERWSVRHRGRIYWLSSRQAMTEFLVNPDASSPVLSGYDPLTFLNEGKLVEGSIQYGLHEQVSGAILLFHSAASKQAYEKNFDRNTQALNALLENAGVK
jgi:thiol-disulfide isomerase/thioredoxin